jgi:hypothetical protein
MNKPNIADRDPIKVEEKEGEEKHIKKQNSIKFELDAVN